ncbi:MAG: CBS domain-containing protein [candidate division Zixibacteria bacterium]
MQVKDVLDDFHKHPITINENLTIGEAMKALNKHKIGSLIVLDNSKSLAGIITERDVFRMMNKFNCDIEEKLIKDYMSTDLIIGVPEDDLEYIAGLITQNRIRHIPVINRDGNLCGIISIGDIVKARLNEAEVENRYLREYISGRAHLISEE